MLVTVIVPNYNHAPYLEKRISSILNQTYQDLEIIILDDMSNDNSIDIINKFRNHPKVKHVIINDFNSGSTYLQWLKGISFAKGEYIWIAESDDWAMEDFLMELVSQTKKFPDVTIAFCDSIYIDYSDTYLFKYEKHFPPPFINGHDFVKHYMQNRNRIYNASMSIFRKSCLKPEIIDEFSLYKFSGDWLLWIRIAQQGNVCYLHNWLNYYRRHPATVSSVAQKELNFIQEGLRIQLSLKNEYTFSVFNRLKFAYSWTNLLHSETANRKIDRIRVTKIIHEQLISYTRLTHLFWFIVKFKWVIRKHLNY